QRPEGPQGRAQSGSHNVGRTMSAAWPSIWDIGLRGADLQARLRGRNPSGANLGWNSVRLARHPCAIGGKQLSQDSGQMSDGLFQFDETKQFPQALVTPRASRRGTATGGPANDSSWD